ncbi:MULTISPECIES: hypothetical protein [unclassified Gilliamella]|uniref:hypothetical protein n=1 Tax=unclassified Gilliamella TaxID=2685620 RepID=UPI001306FCDE|nr:MULTISPECIES: hypothetical protein [unclassified Gilliamella]MWN05034.1 hypothetical protein [Gilliamella sp. Pas-s95]MWP48436.1 hypothetical protein [Gilliamella sp. Lep-s35]MWP68285.1 hypothetical protein [Gilliamella sp. Lep-s5]MWP76576.1 hypothetical protein [Gilliamella sp. Lep-s21]
MQNIQVNRYPALNKILWDYQGQTIPEDEAFKIYERRWCFIKDVKLAANEKKLIHKLIKEYGNGYFLPTCV